MQQVAGVCENCVDPMRQYHSDWVSSCGPHEHVSVGTRVRLAPGHRFYLILTCPNGHINLCGCSIALEPEELWQPWVFLIATRAVNTHLPLCLGPAVFARFSYYIHTIILSILWVCSTRIDSKALILMAVP